jgi:dGTPase
MTNRFYSEFDLELADPNEARTKDERTPFQQDRDRIIYTSSFRRLQAKTQVFFSGEYDFYRTRLTHSIEVAQIGRSICHFLLQKSSVLSENYFIDPELVEAICLAHDIGHPPFGHAGESTINALMKDYGGFEGNAQTLRLITEIIYSAENGREGMNPTRAFVDGVMKYKAVYRTLRTDGKQPENHFLYDDQEKYVKFIFGPRTPGAAFDSQQLNNFRSVECQIMDWADDTAYSVNDLMDGISSGLITIQKIESWSEKNGLKDSDGIREILQAIKSNAVSRTFSRKIGTFIRACRLVESKNFMSDVTHRYRYALETDPEVRKEVALYKNLSRELVFFSPEIYQLEHKRDFILRKIFQAFFENYLSHENSSVVLLPQDVEQSVRSEMDTVRRARLICDYIAGMTDGFAVRTYKRLYDPDFGSFMDLV